MLDENVKKVEQDLSQQTERMNSRIESLKADIMESENRDKEGNLREDKTVRENIAKNYGTAMATIQKEKEAIMKEKLALEERTANIAKKSALPGAAQDDDSLNRLIKDITSNKGVKAQQVS